MLKKLLLVVFALIVVRLLVNKRPLVTTTLNASQTFLSKSQALTPTKEVIDGIPVLYLKTISSPCGILLVAHGCSHSQTDWFDSTSGICEECIGLPEEKAIVQLAHKRNLLVVAMSSENRDHKCWKLSKDGPRAATVLQHFAERYPDAPLYAFGASSGGSFVSQLENWMVPRTPNLSLTGFISQIMASSPPRVGGAVECAVYITMNRDTRTDDKAKAIVADLSKNNDARAKQIRLAPLPLLPDYFANRIKGISLDQSQTMVSSLRQANFLDSETHLFLQDPRLSDWRSILQPHVVGMGDSLVADESPISEVLNVAHGMHEMTRDGVEEALSFCMKKTVSIRSECRV